MQISFLKTLYVSCICVEPRTRFLVPVDALIWDGTLLFYSPRTISSSVKSILAVSFITNRPVKLIKTSNAVNKLFESLLRPRAPNLVIYLLIGIMGR